MCYACSKAKRTCSSRGARSEGAEAGPSKKSKTGVELEGKGKGKDGEVKESTGGSSSEALRVLSEILRELRQTREADDEWRREFMAEFRGLREDLGTVLHINHQMATDIAELQGYGSGFVERYLGEEEEDVVMENHTEVLDDAAEGRESEGNRSEEDMVDETLRD